MSTSSPELTSSVSGAAPSAHPVKTSSGEASVGIREGLSQTREQLADTVEALAHKANLPSGVTEKVHAMKETARAKLGQVKRHLNTGTGVARAKMGDVTQQVRSLTHQAREQVPEPVAGRLSHLTQAVRQRPVPAAALVFTLCALWLLPRQFRRTT
jgi:hypothetical protein